MNRFADPSLPEVAEDLAAATVSCSASKGLDEGMHIDGLGSHFLKIEGETGTLMEHAAAELAEDATLERGGR